MLFEGKIVLITGASKGIGAACAQVFAQEGAKVIINYLHSKQDANQLAQEIAAETYACDITNSHNVTDMIDTIMSNHGRIDILINNAGGYFEGDEWDGSEDSWGKTLQLNLLSVMTISKQVIKIFKEQQSGVMVNISSLMAISSDPESIAYSAAKAGVISLTQSYAKVLLPYGRANVVSPAATRCGYWLTAPQEELEEAEKSFPRKQLLDPQEVARAILFLASESAKNITGQNIILDGGKLLKQ